MTASIIILVKNGARYLSEVLAAVADQTTDIDVQIVAIDSGSVDGSLAILESYGVETVEIPPETFNHGETRNFGAQLTRKETEYLVYLTQDATPADEYWLDRLLAPLRSDPQVAGAFSRHIARSGSSPALVRQLTERWQTGQTVRMVKELPLDRSVYERNKLDYVYFSDTSSVIRRSVWEQIPFPPTGFGEDAAWADLALLAGQKIVFEPSSAVLHSHDFPIIEHLRQNVDHYGGMRSLFPEQVDLSWRDWARAFLAIPREVMADWRFLHDHPRFRDAHILRRARWVIHSPLWHIAATLGAWLGSQQARLPAWTRRSLSRQERVRRGYP